MVQQTGDWLTGAAFARSSNETSEVLSRKKCRSHRQRSGSGTQDDGRYLEQQMREMASAKMGRRRYRRWANDNMLREIAPPLTSSEIGSLFAPPPWGEKNVASPLETVMASTREMALWEPFRNNVDMDVQAKVLQQDVHKRAMGGLGKEGRQSAAMKAWSGVEKNLRAALRRNYESLLLQELEEKLLCFIEGDGEDLFLAIESPYDRLLLHGLSQFHGLKSHTVQMPVDGSGLDQHTCILLRRTEKAYSTVKLSLPQFLKKIKHTDVAAAA